MKKVEAYIQIPEYCLVPISEDMIEEEDNFKTKRSITQLRDWFEFDFNKNYNTVNRKIHPNYNLGKAIASLQGKVHPSYIRQMNKLSDKRKMLANISEKKNQTSIPALNKMAFLIEKTVQSKKEILSRILSKINLSNKNKGSFSHSDKINDISCYRCINNNLSDLLSSFVIQPAILKVYNFRFNKNIFGKKVKSYVIQHLKSILITNLKTKQCKLINKISIHNFFKKLDYHSIAICCVESHNIYIYDVESGKQLSSFRLCRINDPITDFIKLDNSNLVCCFRDSIELWNFKTGKLVKTLQISIPSKISNLIKLNENTIAYTYSNLNNHIYVLDINSEKVFNQLNGHSEKVKCIISFLKDIIASNCKNTVKIWNFITGECIKTLNVYKLDIKEISYIECESPYNIIIFFKSKT